MLHQNPIAPQDMRPSIQVFVQGRIENCTVRTFRGVRVASFKIRTYYCPKIGEPRYDTHNIEVTERHTGIRGLSDYKDGLFLKICGHLAYRQSLTGGCFTVIVADSVQEFFTEESVADLRACRNIARG